MTVSTGKVNPKYGLFSNVCHEEKFKPTTEVSSFYLDDGSLFDCSNETSLPGATRISRVQKHEADNANNYFQT